MDRGQAPLAGVGQPEPGRFPQSLTARRQSQRGQQDREREWGREREREWEREKERERERERESVRSGA